MNAVANRTISSQSTPTVFIVEHDDLTRESIAGLLSSKGATVRAFANAEDFLDEFQANGPSCLIVDEDLPGMNGSDLLHSLVKDQVSLPAVLISAHATIQLTVSAMKHGAVTVLEKPCPEGSLLEAVDEALGKDNARVERERPRKIARERLNDLTDSERQVLQMVLDGTPNKQIANRLGVCVRTVESRRSKIYQTAQVKSVAELVRMCVAAGVVDN